MAAKGAAKKVVYHAVTKFHFGVSAAATGNKAFLVTLFSNKNRKP